MIKIFRKILLNQNKFTGYLANSIVEIILAAIGKSSPFRDLISVEQAINQTAPVPLGTGYVKNLIESQAIWRTYGTLFLFTDLFSTNILSLQDIRNCSILSKHQYYNSYVKML